MSYMSMIRNQLLGGSSGKRRKTVGPGSNNIYSHNSNSGFGGYDPFAHLKGSGNKNPPPPVDGNNNPPPSVDMNKSIHKTDTRIINPDKTANTGENLTNKVIGNIMGRIDSGEPTAGTKAAISQNREAVMTAARNLRAQNANRIFSSGGFGQGTQTQGSQGTEQSILRELAESERDNTKLVSDEQQGLLKLGADIGKSDKALNQSQNQFDANMTENRSQFNELLDQRKHEFTEKLGVEKGQSVMLMLERLAIDNPFIASKLVNWGLAGGEGPIGDFTPAEREKMKAYFDKKVAAGEQLSEMELKLMGKVVDNFDQLFPDLTKEDEPTEKVDSDPAIDNKKTNFNGGHFGIPLNNIYRNLLNPNILGPNGPYNPGSPPTIPIGEPPAPVPPFDFPGSPPSIPGQPGGGRGRNVGGGRGRYGR